MEALGKTQKIRAKVPLAEMFGYSTDLRSKTQGRGDYSIRLRVTKSSKKSGRSSYCQSQGNEVDFY